MAPRLVVGLGNPGSEYERTRHNVGFRLVDRLVGGADVFWRDFKGLGVAAKWGEVWVAKPMTFMNESGRFVRAFADYNDISIAEILVVYDEISLPLGKLRIRKKGSAGGQRGMLSILRHLGTEEVPRLRIGIGPQPEKMDSADFVLSRFKPAEEEGLSAALELAADAIRTLHEEGIDAAMNRFESWSAVTPFFKFAAGCACFLLGLGYLYRPDVIERMNALLREYLLNDAYIALERKKWGTFFLLMGFLFLYMGWTSLSR